MSPDLDVAVVGAGIAGLAVAHRLSTAGRTVHVFESGDDVGGRMRTVRHDGHLVDTGAEMIGTTGYPATWRLIRELGLTEDEIPLIGTELAMWRAGRAHPHVGDPRAVIGGAGLSLPARLNLAGLLAAANLRRPAFDTDRPERTPLGSRTIADAVRRYHRDVHDYLVQPLAAGFFGWDTDRAMAGPLVSHALAVGATRTFRTYRDGMDALARALAHRVQVSTGTTVEGVTETATGARLRVNGCTVSARTVVLCVPAPIAAELHDDAPAYVRLCEYRPMVKAVCLLDRPIAHDGDDIGSFGLLVPAVENPLLAGVIFDDRKHSDRAPAGRGLVTLMAGPGVSGDLLDAGDDDAADLLVRQAARYLPDLADVLREVLVFRHRYGLPMPTAPALAGRPPFLRRRPSAVEYAGDWHLLRPSSEAAVRSAELAADRVLAASGDRVSA